MDCDLIDLYYLSWDTVEPNPAKLAAILWLSMFTKLGDLARLSCTVLWGSGQLGKSTEVIRICREKSIKAKTKLFPTIVKENKKYIYKYISKRRANENLHPLVDAVGKKTTEDKKRLGFSMTSLHLSSKFREIIWGS